MIDVDQLRERMRERATEPDDYDGGHCGNCHADLTAVDMEAGECSNCGSTTEDDDEVLAGDYAWDGYAHGE